ncbi:MAG: hypothetical protein IJ083_08960 [Clostridia bacterium]|nr:hypothetical protein [Clostridia bacterium]
MRRTKYSKIVTLFLLLVCAALLFSSCSSKEDQRFPVAGDAASMPTQNLVTQVTQAPQTSNADETIDFDSGDYDPASEEGLMDDAPLEDVPPAQTVFVATVFTEPSPVPTVNSIYAGATPVILDPIDKPTPTPAPPIVFGEFVTYDATRQGLSFSAPAGWLEDDTQQDSYTITNPDLRVDWQASLTVSAITVNSDYSQSELAKEVKNVLSNWKGQFATFSPTNTATRTLLDKTGVYADFTATTRDGIRVGGRVHAVSVNKRLYIVELTWPRDYQEQYKDNVYKQFRHSVKITK